ncbi:Tripartite motif-containing protein 16 [Anabarilius grahami]|uniref:Tripartite motif-containing protein 16 n=1 Tax=Anabarilius grahami TaxID=495550 RepID=A0A3N0YJC3_ANAGA|nr:Tripartite motif-containing protein 16 [Anabarilius grahami]
MPYMTLIGAGLLFVYDKEKLTMAVSVHRDTQYSQLVIQRESRWHWSGSRKDFAAFVKWVLVSKNSPFTIAPAEEDFATSPTPLPETNQPPPVNDATERLFEPTAGCGDRPPARDEPRIELQAQPPNAMTAAETVCTDIENNSRWRYSEHQLKETQRWFQQRIQQREKDLQQLREAVESHKRSAQTAVEDSERIFTELIRSIERSRSEATQRIRDQEKTAVSRAEGRLERLEQEINDLRRRDAELEQLLHTQDHIHFLQSFQSLSAPPESTDVNDDPFSSFSSFDVMRESVCQLRDILEDFCKEEFKKIFVSDSHRFTLDPNTVNKRLCLSERNRVITFTDTEQSYPDHPDRFDVLQVLCRESVCGRCYWEIEWSGGVYISVSYKSIRRKGRRYECWFGYNDQSWSLFCSSSSSSFRHKKKETKLPVESISSRIGVYVDHSAGTLSFYSVSGDTMSLIHTVQTTFTQPLYPGHRGACARLRSSTSLTSVDGVEQKGYEKLPPLDEAVAVHLCPPTAMGWKSKAVHPSKPCQTTSPLAGHAYTSAGHAASALHSMAVLQVYQAKLLSAMDEAGHDPTVFRQLRSAKHATKTTAQAIGRSMLLERHLWIILMEIKDSDKTIFLDSPISPTGLFGPTVDGFAERITAVQKSSQAM